MLIEIKIELSIIRLDILLERLKQALYVVIVRADLPKMRMTSNTGLPILMSCAMMAMRQ